MIMQENIEIALQNCVSLEHIDKQAEDLQAQAGMFKTRAKVLRSKVWWKLCKMRLLIAFIIVGVRAARVLRSGLPRPRARRPQARAGRAARAVQPGRAAEASPVARTSQAGRAVGAGPPAMRESFLRAAAGAARAPESVRRQGRAARTRR